MKAIRRLVRNRMFGFGGWLIHLKRILCGVNKFSLVNDVKKYLIGVNCVEIA
jgi:hypothetical protein